MRPCVIYIAFKICGNRKRKRSEFMKKVTSAFVMVLCLALVSPRAFAENVWDMAKSDRYGKKAGGMLGRGLVNAATSPMDLIVQTVDNTKEGPPLVGTLTGLGAGLGCTALRASSGILDVATFWVPDWNGFYVSRSYHNCLTDDSTPYMEPAAPQAPIAEQPAPQAPVVVVQEPQHNPMDYVKKGATDEVPAQEGRQQYIK